MAGSKVKTAVRWFVNSIKALLILLITLGMLLAATLLAVQAWHKPGDFAIAVFVVGGVIAIFCGLAWLDEWSSDV